MEIVPLSGYVILEEIKQVSQSGIVLPDQADLERNNQCFVYRSSYNGILENEKVLIRPHLFEETEINGKKYLVGQGINIVARLHD